MTKVTAQNVFLFIITYIIRVKDIPFQLSNLITQEITIKIGSVGVESNQQRFFVVEWSF